MATLRNHYATLNVAPDAETVVIEAAYRALMKKYHPDQAGPAGQGPAGQGPAGQGAPSAADINNAFAVLRDPQRRVEYDHREWTRSQAIQLGQYQQPQPLPRRSNFFGWGGWLVALLLGGAIGIIASQSAGVPPLPRTEAARAASLSGPDFRGQPTAPRAPPAAELAEIRADALLGRSGSDIGASSHRLRGARGARTHIPLRRRGARSVASADKDFVERHGGIY